MEAARSGGVGGRLGRVDWRGASFNLCEGLLRLDAAPEEPCVGGGGFGAGEAGEGGDDGGQGGGMFGGLFLGSFWRSARNS